eukprot:SAG31_NODE_3473_length_4234_cov_1.624667_5_plen_169_part_00
MMGDRRTDRGTSDAQRRLRRRLLSVLLCFSSAAATAAPQQGRAAPSASAAAAGTTSTTTAGGGGAGGGAELRGDRRSVSSPHGRFFSEQQLDSLAAVARAEGAVLIKNLLSPAVIDFIKNTDNISLTLININEFISAEAASDPRSVQAGPRRTHSTRRPRPRAGALLW